MKNAYGKENIILTVNGKSDASTLVINKKCIDYAKYTLASKMTQNLKKVTLTLDEDKANGGVPVLSQDYVVRIDFKNGFGFSDEDSYIKHAAVRVTKAMTGDGGKAKFYEALAISIFKNIQKMYSKVLVVSDGTKDADHVAYDSNGNTNGLANSSNQKLTFTENGIVIKAVEQKEYNPGLTNVNLIDFNIIPTTIMVDGNEEEWGKVETGSAGTVGNGMKVADMEWYFLGDRGDMERGTGGPLRSNNTKGMVVASKEYNILDVQYHWQGDNTVNVGKSPIHLILVEDAEAEQSKLEDIANVFGAAED